MQADILLCRIMQRRAYFWHRVKRKWDHITVLFWIKCTHSIAWCESVSSTTVRARPPQLSHALAASKWWHLPSAACTDYCFTRFVQEPWLSVFEISANSTSLVFVPAPVYSGVKFSLSKMKKKEKINLLLTLLNILCIHKKCCELFYNQLVKTYTKVICKSQQALKRSFSSMSIQPLSIFPHFTLVRKISVALLWHYYKHLVWP